MALTCLNMPGGSATKKKPAGTQFLNIIIAAAKITHYALFARTPEAIVLHTLDKTTPLILQNIGIVYFFCLEKLKGSKIKKPVIK